MNWHDANAIIRLIHGDFLWCGVPVSLAAGHRSKKEAKYDLDATFAYRHARAQERTMLSKFWKDNKKSVVSPKEPQPQGQGMTRRADRFFTKKVAGGPEPEQPTLHGAVESPEGYHSAREHSDFNDNSEEEAQELESEEEPMAESDNSDTSSIRSGCASIRSQHSTTANRDWKRINQKLKATHSNRATNAKKGIRGRSPGWCCPCSETLRKKGRWSMPTGEPKWRSTSRRVTRTTR